MSDESQEPRIPAERLKSPSAGEDNGLEESSDVPSGDELEGGQAHQRDSRTLSALQEQFSSVVKILSVAIASAVAEGKLPSVGDDNGREESSDVSSGDELEGGQAYRRTSGDLAALQGQFTNIVKISAVIASAVVLILGYYLSANRTACAIMICPEIIALADVIRVVLVYILFLCFYTMRRSLRFWRHVVLSHSQNELGEDADLVQQQAADEKWREECRTAVRDARKDVKSARGLLTFIWAVCFAASWLIAFDLLKHNVAMFAVLLLFVPCTYAWFIISRWIREHVSRTIYWLVAVAAIVGTLWFIASLGVAAIVGTLWFIAPFAMDFWNLLCTFSFPP